MGLEKIRAFTDHSALENMATYTSTPIATYIHSANKEVVISAVDTTADTFTSVAHGLNNTDQVYPILNTNVAVGSIFLIDKLPGGITAKFDTGYYVVNKTPDTFQLSLTSGGAAIDLTTNANLDLTKWHFEVMTASVSITGLPSLKRCKIKIKGKQLSTAYYVMPNGISPWSATEFITGSGYGYASFAACGDVFYASEFVIDYYQNLSLYSEGYAIKSASASTVTMTAPTKTIKVSPKYADDVITSIATSAMLLANGTKVEVYRI